MSGTATKWLPRLGVAVAVGFLSWSLCDSPWVAATKPIDRDALARARAPERAPLRAAVTMPDEPQPSATVDDAAQVPGRSMLELPELPERPALPARQAPTRVRVVVKLGTDARGPAVPEPELLRLDEHGQPWPVAALGRKPRHPALTLTLAAGKTRPERARQAVRTFEVTRPGRYVAAWHLWLQVEGTRTWRVCRGRGPEILLSGAGGAKELVVPVGAAELQLERSLDAPARGAQTTVTAKDGE